MVETTAVTVINQTWVAMGGEAPTALLLMMGTWVEGVEAEVEGVLQEVTHQQLWEEEISVMIL